MQAREVLSRSSVYSVNHFRLHFGLGRAETADLEIRWPNGLKETTAKAPADRLIVIREGEGIIRVEDPRC